MPSCGARLSGVRSYSWSGSVTLLVALLSLLLASSAYAQNPTVPQGGSNSNIPKTGMNAPASGSWDILLSGSTVATSSSPGNPAWTVSYNTSTQKFTVGAPGNAQIAPNYTVRTQSGMGPASGVFDVVSGGPPALSSVSVSPTNVTKGISSTGTVTLTTVAPSGGIVVNLSSSNTSVATVPASVTVAQNQLTATFTVTTNAMSSIVQPTDVTIQGTYNSVNKTAVLTVHPAATLANLTLTPAGVTGGSSSTGRVTLSNAPYGTNVTVNLSESHAAATCPATVTVNSGQTYADFTLSTTPVATQTAGTITATLGTDQSNKTLTVYPPQVLGLGFSPTILYGGENTTLTVTLDGPAPTGGWNVYVDVNEANALALNNANNPPDVFPRTVTVPANQSSANFTLKTSTVGVITPVTATAGSATPATVTLLPKYLRVTDIYMPDTLKLEWDSSATGNFQLKRDGTLLATLSNTVRSYLDSFAFVSGQTYLYELFDTATGLPLSREKVKPYRVAASANQTADSRLDKRYATNVFLDYAFKNGVYRGGLFAGYMEGGTPSDSSRTGRSYVKFPVGSAPGGLLRAGTVNAYTTGLNTSGTSVVTYDVGVQGVANDSWDPMTLVWSNAPTVTPANATNFQTLSYNPTNPTAGQKWVRWDLYDPLQAALLGDGVLTAVWTGRTDTTSGWAYFMKKEYDATKGPLAMHAWNIPIPVLMWVKTGTPNGMGGYSVEVAIFVNSVGPGDTVSVQVTGPGVNQAVLVTGFFRTFTFTVSSLPPPGNWSASANGITVSGTGWP